MIDFRGSASVVFAYSWIVSCNTVELSYLQLTNFSSFATLTSSWVGFFAYRPLAVPYLHVMELLCLQVGEKLRLHKGL